MTDGWEKLRHYEAGESVLRERSAAMNESAYRVISHDDRQVAQPEPRTIPQIDRILDSYVNIDTTVRNPITTKNNTEPTQETDGLNEYRRAVEEAYLKDSQDLAA